MKLKFIPEISTWQIRIDEKALSPAGMDELFTFFNGKLRNKWAVLILNQTAVRIDLPTKFFIESWFAMHEPTLEENLVGIAYVCEREIDYSKTEPSRTQYPPCPFKSFSGKKEAIQWIEELLPTTTPLKPIKRITKKRTPKD